MKYCTNCGKELFDEAVMCPGCGTMQEAQTAVVPTPNVQAQTPPVAPKPKKPKKKLSAKQKSTFKKVIISIVAIVVILFAALCVYQLVCGIYINNNLSAWDEKASSGALSQAEWTELIDEIDKLDDTLIVVCNPIHKITEIVCDNYDDYEFLDNWKDEFKSIDCCYAAYNLGKADENDLSAWNEISVLSGYKSTDFEKVQSNTKYNKYYQRFSELVPKEENISVSARLSIDDKRLYITVQNDNMFPVTCIDIEYNFTLMFIGSGYYSSPDYARNSKYLSAKKVPGNSTIKYDYEFNYDKYHNSYSSYIYCTLWDSTIRVTGFETFGASTASQSAEEPLTSSVSSSNTAKEAPETTTAVQTTVATTAPSSGDATIYTVTTSGGVLNMRDGAGESYSVITQIPNGTQIEVDSVDGDWCHTYFDDMYGWVNRQYLS